MTADCQVSSTGIILCGYFFLVLRAANIRQRVLLAEAVTGPSATCAYGHRTTDLCSCSDLSPKQNQRRETAYSIIVTFTIRLSDYGNRRYFVDKDFALSQR